MITATARVRYDEKSEKSRDESSGRCLVACCHRGVPTIVSPGGELRLRAGIEKRGGGLRDTVVVVVCWENKVQRGLVLRLVPA